MYYSRVNSFVFCHNVNVRNRLPLRLVENESVVCNI